VDADLSEKKIVKKKHIVNLVRSMFTHGIDLEFNSKVEELKFLVDIHRFINNRGKLRSYIEEAKIIIETLWFDPLITVEVENGIMSIIPTTDDEAVFSALTEIMYFISFYEIRKTKKKKKPPKPKVPDFEWI
jgi:hypothetical protein